MHSLSDGKQQVRDCAKISYTSSKWVGKFLGQTLANLEGSASFPGRLLLSALQSLSSEGATFQMQPSGYQQAHQVGSQSSEELALVCLQVLADRRNVRDNYYPTQERPAQPSHIWKEAATQRRARETSSCGCFLRLRGRLPRSSHPLCQQHQPLLTVSFRAQGIRCKGRVYLPVQTEWHLAKYHLCSLPLTQTRAHAHARARAFSLSHTHTKVKGETLQKTESDPHAHSLSNIGAARIRHT